MPSVNALQNSLMIAFKRDLVVVDCQPPSKMVTKSSPTFAIKLPCKRTSETPSVVVTVVFALLQLVFAVMAAFIWVSILRMFGVGWLTSIQYRNGRRNQPLPCHFVNRHTATLDFTYVMGNNHCCSKVINQCTLIYILCAMFGHYVTLTLCWSSDNSHWILFELYIQYTIQFKMQAIVDSSSSVHYLLTFNQIHRSF